MGERVVSLDSDAIAPLTGTPERPASRSQACACCASSSADELFVKAEDRYLRCRGCGVVFLRGPSNWAEAHQGYEHLYARFSGFDLLTERRYEERLKALDRYRLTNRLLDVGCGAGHFVQVARRFGWQAEGTEASSQAQALGSRLGLTVHVGELASLPLPAQAFDVVVMLELVEHLEEPAAYLQEAHRLLRPGGALLLSTPNYNSLTRRLIREEWRVFSPEHRHYFTHRSLAHVLRRTGFVPVAISCVNWNPYDVLRRTNARTEEQQLRRRIYANPALRAIKETANVVFASLRLGDTLWVLAQTSTGEVKR